MNLSQYTDRVWQVLDDLEHDDAIITLLSRDHLFDGIVQSAFHHIRTEPAHQRRQLDALNLPTIVLRQLEKIAGGRSYLQHSAAPRCKRANLCSSSAIKILMMLPQVALILV